MRSPCFYGTPTLQTPGLENLGLKTPTPTVGLIVWHNDCVLKNDFREINFKFFY